eukprot:gene6152-7854_t
MGEREKLAKAVVLECAMAAARNKRDCMVVAFSGRGNIRTKEVRLGMTKEGTEALLDFLEHSFHGGTDVEAPLARALEILETTPLFINADVLLVTDGELMDPPLTKDLMKILRHHQSEKGLEVHGLLVGRNGSAPLSLICNPEGGDGVNRVHDCLRRFDPIAVLRAYESSAQFQRERETPSVFSMSGLRLVGGGDATGSQQVGAHSRRVSSASSAVGVGRFSALASRLYGGMARCRGTAAVSSSALNMRSDVTTEETVYREMSTTESLDAIVVRLREAQDKQIARQTAAYSKSTASLQGDLQILTRALRTGLVERDEEVKLLVLSALCREHLLLIGPPGT